MAIFLRNVEQRREHLAGEFHRDVAHPVEVFVARQVVEDLAGAFANDRFEIHQVARREHRRDDLALIFVLRRIFLNEHRQVELRIGIGAAAEADAADLRIGREDLVIRVGMHDVGELRQRPIRAELTLRAVMHRRFVAQPLEIRPHRVGLEQRRVTDVDRLRAESSTDPA